MCTHWSTRESGLFKDPGFAGFLMPPKIVHASRDHHILQQVVEDTGLGVSIIRKLAELMGGRIQADSTFGRRTRVEEKLKVNQAGTNEEQTS